MLKLVSDHVTHNFESVKKMCLSGGKKLNSSLGY